jgi:hypothetical protein
MRSRGKMRVGGRKVEERKCERRDRITVGFITLELRDIHWGCQFSSAATLRLHNVSLFFPPRDTQLALQPVQGFIRYHVRIPVDKTSNTTLGQ